MNNNRSEFVEFEKRKNLPSRATKENLLEIGARCFLGEAYTSENGAKQIQQMQYESNGKLYLWKRMGSLTDIKEKLFEIHMEITQAGYIYFPTL